VFDDVKKEVILLSAEYLGLVFTNWKRSWRL